MYITSNSVLKQPIWFWFGFFFQFWSNFNNLVYLFCHNNLPCSSCQMCCLEAKSLVSLRVFRTSLISCIIAFQRKSKNYSEIKPNEKYENSSTALWETCRRVQEEGKLPAYVPRGPRLRGLVEPQVVGCHTLICLILLRAPFGPMSHTAGEDWPRWTMSLGAVVSHESFPVASPLHLASATSNPLSIRLA